jgi:hypothetical protein
MSFKKPDEVEKGPVWKGESGSDNEAESGHKTSETVEFQVAGDDEPMVLSVDEAVELASEMLADPEAFGIASEKRVRELEEENEKLRDDLQQQRKAIADLADAVESLGKYQASLADSSYLSTVELDPTAFGDIYTTTLVEGIDDG